MRRKKVLTLVLTLALALSVAAGAAFTDQKQIKNTEAVDMCVALNIISGYPDGSYKPGGNITRAEFTKMLCVLLNGGNTPATATKATPTFSDIRTSANASWAEGFIEYCYAKGIVSGIGGGKFNPNGNVTATEAAKMLLVALGYNATVEGYTGAAWALKVNVQANQDGLYKGLEKIDTNAALTRDNAAQMVWNALQAYVIDKSSSIDRTDGSVTDIYTKSTTVDLLAKMYKGDIFEGTLTGFTYDSNKDKWTYVVTAKDQDDVKVTSKTDYTALLNQNVKAVYDKTGKQPYDAYGIFAVDSEVSLSGVFGDLPNIAATDKSFKVDGVKYTLSDQANKTIVKLFNTKTTLKLSDIAVKGMAKYDAQKFVAIDEDGDGDIDYFMVVPFALAKVTYVNADKFKVSVKYDPFNVMGKDANDNPIVNATYDIDDVNTYEKMAKDDYVTIVVAANTSDNTDTFVKAELVSGKIATKSGSDVTIGDKSYTMDASVTATFKAGTTVTDSPVVNGYIFDPDTSNKNDVTDYAVVVNIVKSSNNGLNGDQAKLMFSDGTKKVVDLDKAYNFDKGDLVTYDTNKDGEYELTAATIVDTGFDYAADTTNKYVNNKTSALAPGESDVTTAKNSSKALYVNGYKLTDSSVIFVKYDVTNTGASYKVISGATMKTMAADKFTVNSYVLATDDSKLGLGQVDMAYVTLNDSSIKTADSHYAYVTDVQQIENADKDQALKATLWTDKGAQTIETVKMTEGVTFGTSKDIQDVVVEGWVIEYTVDADGYIDDVLNAAEVKASNAVAITGWDGDAFWYGGSRVEIDDDIVYLFIDSSETEGVSGLTSADINTADDAINGGKTPNAIIWTNNDGDVVLVVYDVDNEIE